MSTYNEISWPLRVMVRSGLEWQRMQSAVPTPSGVRGRRRILWGWWQSMQEGTLWGSCSQSRPSTTLTCTSSMREWHFMHVLATLLRLMLESGLLWSRIRCEVWQEVHTAVTVSPFSKRPWPWMDME